VKIPGLLTSSIRLQVKWFIFGTIFFCALFYLAGAQSQIPTVLLGQSSLQITSPNGGEKWELGTTHNITWTTTLSGVNVAIYLLKNDAFVGTIGYVPITDCSFNWIDGNYKGGTAVAANDYKILLQCNYNNTQPTSSSATVFSCVMAKLSLWPPSFIFIRGVLSFLQIIFLPGFLLLLSLKLNRGLLQTFILSFSMSLILNFFLVFILTAMGLYTATMITAVICGEIILLAWLVRKEWKKSLGSLLKEDRRCWAIFAEYLNGLPQLQQLIHGAIILTALGTMVFFLVKAIGYLGSIFNIWDSIVSWNRWAIDWSLNKFPALTWHYPQLMPANWSLSYVFLKSELQMFPSATMLVFPIAVLLTLWDMGIRFRQIGYFASVTFTGYMTFALMGTTAFSGYVDVAVGFLALAAVYLLLLAREKKTTEEIIKYIGLGAISAAGSALCKQSGLFIAILFPFLSYWLVLRKNYDLSSRNKIKITLLILLIIFTLTASWYGYKEIQIHRGIDLSEIATTTGIVHQGRSFGQRFVFALDMLAMNFGGHLFPALWIGFSLALLSFFHFPWRWLTIVCGLPYFFIWAFFFSYDQRNLVFVVPILGTSMGIGLQMLISQEKVYAFLGRKLSQVKVIVYFIMAFTVIIVGSGNFSKQELIRSQILQLKKMTWPAGNDMLYQSYEKGHIKGKILTNYQLLNFLPGLKKFYEYNPLDNLAAFLSRLKTGEIKHVLFIWDYKTMNAPLKQCIEEKLRDGEFEPMPLALPGILFIKILKVPQ